MTKNGKFLAERLLILQKTLEQMLFHEYQNGEHIEMNLFYIILMDCSYQLQS